MSSSRKSKKSSRSPQSRENRPYDAKVFEVRPALAPVVERPPFNKVYDFKYFRLGLEEILLLTVLLAFTFALTTFPLVADDIWYYLKFAEFLYTKGQLLKVDVFSYTYYGHPWVNHEWLAMVIFYAIYALGGINGLVIFKVILMLAMVIITYFLSRQMTKEKWLAFILVAFCLFTASDRIIERAHIFKYLLLPVTIAIFLNFKFNKGEGRVIYAIPVLFLFWVNLHSSISMAIIIFIIFVFLETIGTKISPKTRNPLLKLLRTEVPKHKVKLLWIIFAISIGTLFINPFGLKFTKDVLIYPFEMFFKSDIHRNFIYEWMPVSVHLYRRTLLFYLLYVSVFIYIFLFLFKPEKKVLLHILGVGILTFIIFKLFFDKKCYMIFAASIFIYISIFSARFRRFYFFPLIVFTMFNYLAFSSIRFISVLAMVSIPLIYWNLQELDTREARYYLNWATIVLFLFGTFYILAFGYKTVHLHRNFGLGVTSHLLPDAALAFLDREKIDGVMMNQYDIGTYLIWKAPHRKVFIDGRYTTLYDISFYEEYLSQSRSLQDFYNINHKYKFDYYFIMNISEWPRPGNNPTIFDFLSNVKELRMVKDPTRGTFVQPVPMEKKEWILVYWDDIFLIYVKNIPKFQKVIEKHECKYYTPVYPPQMTIARHSQERPYDVLKELERLESLNPKNKRLQFLKQKTIETINFMKQQQQRQQK